MAFSLRLDAETEAKIRRYAEATGKSKAAVVRKAMELYMAAEVQETKLAPSALDRLRPYVGIISTNRQFSTNTHEKFRAIVAEKLRARRTR
jgi:predicted DNA-binding protein